MAAGLSGDVTALKLRVQVYWWVAVLGGANVLCSQYFLPEYDHWLGGADACWQLPLEQSDADPSDDYALEALAMQVCCQLLTGSVGHVSQGLLSVDGLVPLDNTRQDVGGIMRTTYMMAPHSRGSVGVVLQRDSVSGTPAFVGM